MANLTPVATSGALKLKTILAVAAIAMSAGPGNSINSAYTQQRDKQHEERMKSAAKKQRIREQIRARRAAKKDAA